LDELGLNGKANEFVGNLSGGEQKRLSIALELIDNPKIMFFDEPTTGLDSCASTQCILLLKKLAESGRTIICTIHQPSGMIFNMFDYVYAIADGKCIYKGACENLVNFLAELDLICPSTYNPADYLLEIANNDYGELNQRLSEKITSTENLKYRIIPHKHQTNCLKCDMKTEILPKVSTLDRIQNEIFELTKRNFLKYYRDKSLTIMRLGIHTAIGFFVGLMYLGIGQEASDILNIYKFLFFNVFILMFTAFSSLQTVCE
jgi:ABC-type multidrug transport system ATPase subunit